MHAYKLYKPSVSHHAIHEGKFEKGHYPYNHMASVEWFDGKFYAVWGGNPNTHRESQPGQVLLLSTSEDFAHWTDPVEFVGLGAENPVVDPKGVQWQPNLLNYYDEELWCLWCNAKSEKSGTYFSRLSKKPGARWVNRLLFEFHHI